MNLLFRMGGDGSVEEAKHYFKEELPIRDDNYFFDIVKRNKLTKNDTIYFSYNSFIVAKTAYKGSEIKTLPERDAKFIHGHEVENIEIINSDLKLDTQIVGTRTRYLNTPELQQEIDRVLKENFIEIYPDEIEDNDLNEGAKKQVAVNA